jgi:hypothetical protein
MSTAVEHMAATLLRLAGAERDAGNELRAEIFEAAADLTGATCSACGAPLIGGVADAEPPGPPVDGREVDRAPERPHLWLDGPDGDGHRDCVCPIGYHHWAPPETDGRSAVPPTADLPSPHAEPHECCPDCGDDPNDHTLHAPTCRRIGAGGLLQDGPPWKPWPETDGGVSADGGVT